MKKIIANTLIVLMVMTGVVVAAPFTPVADTVSAATTWTEGSTTTTTSTAPATATVTAATTAGNYTVVKGDTLAKIAAKSKITLTELLALNPTVKKTSVLKVGQKLVVVKYKTVYEGLGVKSSFRNGPGADSENVPVYSFNLALAKAVFDDQGRIIDVYIDGLEVATPNYDGASMPHFSGWPGITGYNVTDHATEKVTGKSTNTVESATAEVAGWLTKRQRGDSYGMNAKNEWYKQMNFYQNFFKGKTVAELEAWFAKYTTTAGRPIKATTTNATDLAKFNALTAAEKAALADVVSGATMSLRDAHGDFLGAVGEAYKNRVAVQVPVN